MSFHGQRNFGSKSFSNLSKVTQPARSRAKWKTHVSDKGLVTTRHKFMPLSPQSWEEQGQAQEKPKIQE